jgi:hypothetical protein
MDALPCKDTDLCCYSSLCLLLFVLLTNVFLLIAFRMTMAAWVSSDLIPGSLPVWHP